MRDPIVTAGDDGHLAASPFATYPGGKGAAGSAQQIAGRFPWHSVYVEPFLGGGAVLRAKRPALWSVGIDCDQRVIDRWTSFGWPGLELVHGDGIAWLGDGGSQIPADALVYADPPYPHETRSRRRLYSRELSAADHRGLVDLLLALPCSVFVSSYANRLYQRAFDRRGWRHVTWRAMTRGGPRIEHLWFRCSPAAALANPDVAGRNFRERERIKRKSNRWLAKFEVMPHHERQVILHKLLEANQVPHRRP